MCNAAKREKGKNVKKLFQRRKKRRKKVKKIKSVYRVCAMKFANYSIQGHC